MAGRAIREMKNNNRRIRLSKTVKRFIISFLFAFFLPVFIFITLFMRNYYLIYRENIVKQSTAALALSGGELERNVEGFHNIVAYHSLSARVSRDIIQKEYTGTTVLDILSAELATHSVLEKIFYYNSINSEIVYSPTGTYTVDYYKRLFTGIDPGMQLSDYLRGNDRFYWEHFVIDDQNTTLQYFVRGNSNEWWIFMVSQEALMEMLDVENALTVLTDLKGDVLFSTGDVEREHCITLNYDSEGGRFRLIRYLDQESMFAELYNLQNGFYLIVLMLMAVGIVLTLVLTYYNEIPIRRLIAYCQRKTNKPLGDHNGLDGIEFFANIMEEQNRFLEKQERQNRLLQYILYSTNCETKHFLASLEREGMLQHAECYRVIKALCLNGESMRHNKMKLFLDLADLEEYEFWLINRVADDALILLMGASETADHRLNVQLEYLSKLISETDGEEVVFLVGQKCLRLDQIHFAFEKLISANVSELPAETDVIFLEDNDKNEKPFCYPNKQINKLSDALVGVDTNGARMLTDELIGCLQENRDNQYIRVLLYYDIMNAYYRAWMRLERDGDIDFMNTELFDVRGNVDYIYMIKQIEKQYQGYVEHVAGCGNEASTAKTQENSDDGQWIRAVKDYIENGCDVKDICVNAVAEHFGMSISYISHKFKHYVGKNISEYIVDVKLAYACKLLAGTDYSVKEISEMLGYSHPNSFIRKFKQHFDATPAEFREKHLTK